MGLVLHALGLAATVTAIWSGVAVLLAVMLSALFRAGERSEARWRQAERRQLWIEATR